MKSYMILGLHWIYPRGNSNITLQGDLKWHTVYHFNENWGQGRKDGMCNICSQERLQSWSRKPERLSPAHKIRVTDSAETRRKKSKKSPFMMPQVWRCETKGWVPSLWSTEPSTDRYRAPRWYVKNREGTSGKVPVQASQAQSWGHTCND